MRKYVPFGIIATVLSAYMFMTVFHLSVLNSLFWGVVLTLMLITVYLTKDSN